MRFLALTLLVGSGAAIAEHPLSSPKVYLGKDGLRVVTAAVKAPSNDRCVMLMTGPPGELEGLVLDCRAERQDAQTTYWIVRKGRELRAMRATGDGFAGLGMPTQLEFSDGESKKENLEALWARHQAQVASGQLAAFTRFDRQGEELAASQELATASEPLQRACESKLPFTLDWSAASDEIFKSTRANVDCLRAIEVMKEMCLRWKIVRSTFKEKLTEVRCTFDGAKAPRLSVTATTLNVGTNQFTASLPGELDRFLRESL